MMDDDERVRKVVCGGGRRVNLSLCWSSSSAQERRTKIYERREAKREEDDSLSLSL